MRSKLFVPGTRPELFAKAMASDADAISFDLEDSVPADGKDAARERVVEFLRSARTTKRIIVRVNPLDSPHFAPDIAALAGLKIDLINLPKIERADDVRAAVAEIEAAGCEDARLLVNIETPLGLARAAEIAGAHPAVAGLQIGLNDLFAPLRIDRGDLANVHAALWSLRMASGAAGCFAYDGAWPDVADGEGYRREAELARSLGFLGKSCIHPSQIGLANAVFADDDAVAEARRIVAAARAAAGEGRGAFLLDGRMIDLPAIAHAESVLADAEAGR